MGIMFNDVKSNINNSLISELKNIVMLDSLISSIDNIDSSLLDEEYYISNKDYYNFILKITNQNISLKLYKALLINISNNEYILKYDLYVLLILISKGSFESKAYTIFCLFCITDDNVLYSEDFIFLVKCVYNSVLKALFVNTPCDDTFIKFFKNKCPDCLLFDDSFK